jgi:hypothetical protein
MRNERIFGLLWTIWVLGYCESVTAIPAVFNDLNPQVIFNTGNSPPQPRPFTPGDCPDCPFEITNNTGLVWTDFHIDLVPHGLPGSFGFIDFLGGGYDGMGYEGPGTEAFSDFFHSLDIMDLNVPHGGVLTFTVDIDHFEFKGTLDVVAFPTISEPMAGDFDGDGDLDVADIDLLTAEALRLTNTPRFDLNHDNRVDSTDRVVWVEEIRKTYFGDSNLDGEFNSTDFIQVFQVGEYEDATERNSTWADGDWNGDMEFKSSDFVTAFQAGGYEKGPRPGVASVPEPCGIALWGLLIMFTMRQVVARNGCRVP